MKNISIFVILGMAAISAGCDDPLSEPTKVECPSDAGPFLLESSRVTGTIEFDPPLRPLGRGDSIVVTGTAHHEDGLAIREVRVAGAGATRSEFNFERWSATVSYEALVTSAAANDEGQVTFEAWAIDACGNRYPFAQAVVQVDATPNVSVDGLVISVEYPEEREYLPASGAVPAIVTVSGSGRAVGAVVSVQTDHGRFQGADELGHVVLSAPAGELDVGSATLLFYGDVAGTATLVATVEDKLAVALVRVAGEPTLSPRRATLAPGSSLEVDVAGEGDITCAAQVEEDLMVTHQDAPLSIDPMTIDLDEGNRRVLVVTAAAEPLSTDLEVVVTCTDVYGQDGSGRYRLGDAVAIDPFPEEGR